MAISDGDTEQKIVQIIQMMKWASCSQRKISLSAAVLVEQFNKRQISLSEIQVRGNGLKTGIVGRKSRFHIITPVDCMIDLIIDIRGPNNEKNSEHIISCQGDCEDYKNNNQVKFINDKQGNKFIRQKSLDDDSCDIISFDCQCVGDGRFLITYIPRSHGVLVINIKSHGHNIKGSPFEVKISDFIGSMGFGKNLSSRSMPFDCLPSIVDKTLKKSAAKTSQSKIEKRAVKQATVKRRRVIKRIITKQGDEILLPDTDVSHSPSLSRHSSEDVSEEDNHDTSPTNSIGPVNYAKSKLMAKILSLRSFSMGSQSSVISEVETPDISLNDDEQPFYSDGIKYDDGNDDFSIDNNVDHSLLSVYQENKETADSYGEEDTCAEDEDDVRHDDDDDAFTWDLPTPKKTTIRSMSDDIPQHRKPCLKEYIKTTYISPKIQTLKSASLRKKCFYIREPSFSGISESPVESEFDINEITEDSFAHKKSKSLDSIFDSVVSESRPGDNAFKNLSDSREHPAIEQVQLSPELLTSNSTSLCDQMNLDTDVQTTENIIDVTNNTENFDELKSMCTTESFKKEHAPSIEETCFLSVGNIDSLNIQDSLKNQIDEHNAVKNVTKEEKYSEKLIKYKRNSFQRQSILDCSFESDSVDDDQTHTTDVHTRNDDTTDNHARNDQSTDEKTSNDQSVDNQTTYGPVEVDPTPNDQSAAGHTQDYPTADGHNPDYPTADGHNPDYPTADGHTPDYPTADGHNPDYPTADGHNPDYSTEDGKNPDYPTEDCKNPDYPTEDGHNPDYPTDGHIVDGEGPRKQSPSYEPPNGQKLGTEKFNHIKINLLDIREVDISNKLEDKENNDYKTYIEHLKKDNSVFKVDRSQKIVHTQREIRPTIDFSSQVNHEEIIKETGWISRKYSIRKRHSSIKTPNLETPKARYVSKERKMDILLRLLEHSGLLSKYSSNIVDDEQNFNPAMNHAEGTEERQVQSRQSTVDSGIFDNHKSFNNGHKIISRKNYVWEIRLDPHLTKGSSSSSVSVSHDENSTNISPIVKHHVRQRVNDVFSGSSMDSSEVCLAENQDGTTYSDSEISAPSIQPRRRMMKRSLAHKHCSSQSSSGASAKEIDNVWKKNCLNRQESSVSSIESRTSNSVRSEQQYYKPNYESDSGQPSNQISDEQSCRKAVEKLNSKELDSKQSTDHHDNKSLNKHNRSNPISDPSYGRVRDFLNTTPPRLSYSSDDSSYCGFGMRKSQRKLFLGNLTEFQNLSVSKDLRKSIVCSEDDIGFSDTDHLDSAGCDDIFIDNPFDFSNRGSLTSDVNIDHDSIQFIDKYILTNPELVLNSTDSANMVTFSTSTTGSTEITTYSIIPSTSTIGTTNLTTYSTNPASYPTPCIDSFGTDPTSGADSTYYSTFPSPVDSASNDLPNHRKYPLSDNESTTPVDDSRLEIDRYDATSTRSSPEIIDTYLPTSTHVIGTGIIVGLVDVKNHFQVLTVEPDNGILTVGIKGPRPHCVKETSINYTGSNIYEITYEVSSPGEYYISVKWSDRHIQNSPFLCCVE